MRSSTDSALVGRGDVGLQFRGAGRSWLRAWVKPSGLKACSEIPDRLFVLVLAVLLVLEIEGNIEDEIDDEIDDEDDAPNRFSVHTLRDRQGRQRIELLCQATLSNSLPIRSSACAGHADRSPGESDIKLRPSERTPGRLCNAPVTRVMTPVQSPCSV